MQIRFKKSTLWCHLNFSHQICMSHLLINLTHMEEHWSTDQHNVQESKIIAFLTILCWYLSKYYTPVMYSFWTLSQDKWDSWSHQWETSRVTALTLTFGNQLIQLTACCQKCPQMLQSWHFISHLQPTQVSWVKEPLNLLQQNDPHLPAANLIIKHRITRKTKGSESPQINTFAPRS